MKIDYTAFYDRLKNTDFEPWLETLPGRITDSLDLTRHGRMSDWEKILGQLPTLTATSTELRNELRVSGSTAPDLEPLLRQFHPWRKGPYHIHGISIDTEWRSDWKWDRVLPHLDSLEGRNVLDVGCGNGYHGWRMVGAGANLAIGIDPTPLYVCQFFAMKQYLQNPHAWVLPLSLEELPALPGAFDTVFSMGVLYHRRSPIEHLDLLKSFLRPNGQIVLETLVVDGPEDRVFVPPGRYAKMRNVWFIPSTDALTNWLQRCGFKNVRTVDVTTTAPEEQRSTDWMTYESLPDFLDPTDATRTREGHPAPRRATLIATA